MPLKVFEALEAGDLESAASRAPVSLPLLPPFLISGANRGIWRRRLNSVAADPEHAPWISRVVVYENAESQSFESGKQGAVIVGRIGFHGKPDEHGMVEVGYEIDPAQRRRGHASAAMRIIVDVARAIQGVKVLRAGVVEENWISRRVIQGVGMRKVGTERHERRGLEENFVMDVSE